MNTPIQYVITISSDLKPLIPKFLKSRRLDIEKLESALQRKDLATILNIAHKIKGNAGSFGFTDFGKLAIALERDVKIEDFKKLEESITTMKNYLNNSTIVYSEQSA